MADGDLAKCSREANSSKNNTSKKQKIGHKCCAVANCTSRSDNRPELSFHEFPKDVDLKKKWENAMKRGDERFAHVNNKFCCSLHFVKSDFKPSLTGLRRDLKKGAIPSFYDVSNTTNDRAERVNERAKKRKTEITRKTQFTDDQMNQNATSHSTATSLSQSLPTDVSSQKEHIQELQEKISQLQNEIVRAKEREKISTFGMERFSSSDEDINFYTGFPDYATLLKFWEYIESDASRLTYYSYARGTEDVDINADFPFLNTQAKKFPGSNVGAQRKLQPIDEFWLFLCRIRLGLFERDLAFRFNISVSTVSDIVVTWSNFLFVVLGSFPKWASRETITEHLPEVFKGRFEKIRCIIDCTEIKVQKPLCLDKQSELYSEYKSHNTYKGLVGISPNVWVTFVSNLYGGSISDKEVVVKSHMIDLLEHSDVIMADRGFDIQDILATKKVTLYIPPKRFSASDQLTKEECFDTMRIANVRIHIERAIRRVKGWHIFDQVLPLSMNGIVNQLWTVCCLLVNWQKPALTC